jgi:hypothetical protein
VYVGVNRASPPATIALKLAEVIRIYRFRCTRVTDYQVFIARPNLLDIKAKCSGDPLYGVTVASNGYVAVYGGNGMVSALDRRDGIIYSFSADGAVESDSRLTADEALGETVERLQVGDGYNFWYTLAIFAVMVAIIIAISGVWLRMWRKRKGKHRHHRRVKPMARHTVQASSEIKNQLLKESERVAAHVYLHPSGIYLGVGKRGKRRFFKSRFWAVMYRTFGLRMFETSAPPPVHPVPVKAASPDPEMAAGAADDDFRSDDIPPDDADDAQARQG